MSKKSKRIKARASTTTGMGSCTDGLRSFFLGRDFLFGAILFLVVGLTYLPVWHAGFVWDDASHVTANPCIVGPLGLKEIWTTPAALVCPLVLTTFWLEHAAWGLIPLPYHLVNVVQHGFCAILLWRVLLGLRLSGAWLGAGLWALHPLQVESVAWISEMKNTQSCLFYLLTVLFFVKWLTSTDSDPRRLKWCYALTLLFAALAMASKFSTAVLPAALALCAWWVEGRWRARTLVRLGPICLMSAIVIGITLWPQAGESLGTPHPAWAGTWPERVARAGFVIWFYVGKLIWPHPLMALYPRWEIDASQWTSYLPTMAALVLFVVLWLYRRTWARPYFFAWAYFLVTLSPFLTLIDQSFWRFSYVEDHLQNLAGIGPLALAGAGLDRLSAFAAPIFASLRLQWSAGIGVMLVMAVLSWQRVIAFQSDQSLWADTLTKNPKCWLAHNNFGVALLHSGQIGRAISEYQTALALRPDDAEAEKNLGVAYFRLGNTGQAIVEYQQALSVEPDDAEICNKLGMAYARMGQEDKAVAEYERAERLMPEDAEAYNNLGISFFDMGRMDDAIQQYRKALAIDPMDAQAHSNLAFALLRAGAQSEALAHYQRTVEIQPDYALAYKNYGSALAQLGRLDEAVEQYQKALKLDPNYAEAYNDLGVALYKLGQLSQAVSAFHEAIRLKPDDDSARRNLAAAQMMQMNSDSLKQ
jgi:protein O-mannosyl-transferase